KSSIVPHSGYSDDSVISYHLLPLCQVCRRKVLFGCVSGRGLLWKGCVKKAKVERECREAVGERCRR
ncbi:MAG: hypothetical protein QXT77_04750, partial [Candidatus Methanomethylicaceae archaeon]